MGWVTFIWTGGADPPAGGQDRAVIATFLLRTDPQRFLYPSCPVADGQ
jgi:hypothetical protein